jgi:ABC-type uncharacterized transport system YnjBCD substrate-binding protein
LGKSLRSSLKPPKKRRGGFLWRHHRNCSKRIADLFEKKYGIKMKHWRGDATEIVNRAVTEARAGRPTFDVTLGNEAVMAGIIERKLL